jgi:two-component SAPR family response regulator
LSNISSISNIINPISLSAATLTALENVTVDSVVAPITISNTSLNSLASISNIYNPISLSATTLTALENVTVDSVVAPITISNTSLNSLSSISNIYNPVSLSASTLTALENVTVDSVVAPITISNTSLNSLSSISNIYNPISLSATTLTALENVTVDSVVAPVSLSTATINSLSSVSNIYNPVSLSTSTINSLQVLSNIINPIDISTNTLSSLSNYDIDLTNTTIYGRYRTVKPTVLFSLHHSLGYKSLSMDTLVSGTGTATRNDTISSHVLQVTANAGKVVYQTKEYFTYSCGQSKLTYISAVLQVASSSGTRSRVGVFDDNVGKTVDTRGNGFFFEYYQNLLYVVYRTSTDGTTGTDTRVVQTSWNYDHLDGGGYSGFNINVNLVNTFAIEFNSMGDDIARIGVIYKGKICWCHVFDFSALAYPYLLSFKLPVRWELENISSGAVTTQLRAISCSVMIEGDIILNQSNMIHGIFHENIIRTVTNISWFPLVCFRLQTTGARRSFAIKRIVVSSLALAHHWRLVYGGTTTGATWLNVTYNADSLVQTSITNTAYTLATGTTGYPYASGTCTAASTQTYEFTPPYPVILGASVAGTSDTITFEAAGYATATTLYYSIDWVEYY